MTDQEKLLCLREALAIVETAEEIDSDVARNKETAIDGLTFFIERLEIAIEPESQEDEHIRLEMRELLRGINDHD